MFVAAESCKQNFQRHLLGRVAHRVYWLNFVQNENHFFSAAVLTYCYWKMTFNIKKKCVRFMVVDQLIPRFFYIMDSRTAKILEQFRFAKITVGCCKRTRVLSQNTQSFWYSTATLNNLFLHGICNIFEQKIDIYFTVFRLIRERGWADTSGYIITPQPPRPKTNNYWQFCILRPLLVMAHVISAFFWMAQSQLNEMNGFPKL